MPKIKLAILGCRGIPNHYGGFEELAQYLSEGLVQQGLEVTVYNSDQHPYKENNWHGVNIIHCKDREGLLGKAGQFIYDRNCIRNARKQQFDVLLFLGYTSSSIWGKWFPPNTAIISNMDGLEWKRSKYPKLVQVFLQYAEKLAVKYSNYLIADSPVIQSYLKEKYKVESNFIPYGAEVVENINIRLLNNYNVSENNYFMLMARMEPENNIEMILDGFHLTDTTKKMLVIGNTKNAFGKRMEKKFQKDKRIVFGGPVYGKEITHALRRSCAIYFHGHSVGGTNPSLLEAMADKAFIAAHENDFNKSVLGSDAYYFASATDVAALLSAVYEQGRNEQMKKNNFKKVQDLYTWNHIVEKYKTLIITAHNDRK